MAFFYRSNNVYLFFSILSSPLTLYPKCSYWNYFLFGRRQNILKTSLPMLIIQFGSILCLTLSRNFHCKLTTRVAPSPVCWVQSAKLGKRRSCERLLSHDECLDKLGLPGSGDITTRWWNAGGRKTMGTSHQGKVSIDNIGAYLICLHRLEHRTTNVTRSPPRCITVT